MRVEIVLVESNELDPSKTAAIGCCFFIVHPTGVAGDAFFVLFNRLSLFLRVAHLRHPNSPFWF